MRELHFAVEGEFVTELARRKLTKDYDLNAAIELLESALVTDQLNELEKKGLIFDILRGSMGTTGTYPGDDYGVVDTPENKMFLHNAIKDIGNQLNELADDNERMMRQLETLDEILPEKYKKQANNATGETVFPDDNATDIIESFRRTNEDYGWLSPTGEFIPVDFGNHEQFALKYLREHVALEDTPAIMKKYHSSMTDWLIYERNFVLLHNPSLGPAILTRNETRTLTRAQKDFLFDYFTTHDRDADANKIMEQG